MQRIYDKLDRQIRIHIQNSASKSPMPLILRQNHTLKKVNDKLKVTNSIVGVVFSGLIWNIFPHLSKKLTGCERKEIHTYIVIAFLVCDITYFSMCIFYSISCTTNSISISLCSRLGFCFQDNQHLTHAHYFFLLCRDSGIISR